MEIWYLTAGVSMVLYNRGLARNAAGNGGKLEISGYSRERFESYCCILAGAAIAAMAVSALLDFNQ